MGKLTYPSQVKLIIGIMVKPHISVAVIENHLVEKWGVIDLRSESFVFSRHTAYYEKEMGTDLRKYWISFDTLVDRLALPRIKNKTNELECRISQDPVSRDVNLDPGYFTPANLVLASTKDFSHRIYLGDGIFGDLHLIYENKKFNALPWTYADYRQPDSLDFFIKVRHKYMGQLKNKD